MGNDVWIGYQAVLLPGVHIGDGAIVGAASVVTADVPPYAIVAGNPARVITMRFEQPMVQKLLRIQWWNWTAKKISNHLPAIQANDLQRLLTAH